MFLFWWKTIFFRKDKKKACALPVLMRVICFLKYNSNPSSASWRIVPEQILDLEFLNPSAALVPEQILDLKFLNPSAALVPEQILDLEFLNPSATLVPLK